MVIKLKKEDLNFAFAGFVWVMVVSELFGASADKVKEAEENTIMVTEVFIPDINNTGNSPLK